MLVYFYGRIDSGGPMHQFDDSKSGGHLETGPEKSPAVVANILERQGVTGHNVRHVLFFGLTAVIIAFGLLLVSYFS
jgi:hypothetical protein